MFEEYLSRELAPLLGGFSGRAGLALHRFADGFRFELAAREPGPAASLIKLPILVEALRQVEEGKLDLRARTLLSGDEKVGGTGLLQDLDDGLLLSLHDLLTLMITVSDNTATNLVLNLTGQEEVNALCRRLGLESTWLSGKLAVPADRQNEAQRRGERHRSSPADMLELLVGLEAGRLLGADMTRVAKGIMRKQRMTEALARYLPTDPELDPKAVAVASKSGCLRGVWNDAAIVYDQSGGPLYALAVMTSGAADRGYGWEQEGMMLIARSSAAVFAALTGRGIRRS